MNRIYDDNFNTYLTSLGYAHDYEIYESYDEVEYYTIRNENYTCTIKLTLEIFHNKYSYLWNMYHNGRKHNIKDVASLLSHYDLNEKIAYSLWDVDTLSGSITPKDRISIVFQTTKFLKNVIKNGIQTKPIKNGVVVSHPLSPRKQMLMTNMKRVEELTKWSQRLGYGKKMVDNRLYLYYDENIRPQPIDE